MRVRLAYLLTLISLVAALAIIACGSSAPSSGDSASAGGGNGSAETAKESATATPEADVAAEMAAATAAGYIPAVEMAQHLGQEITAQGKVKDYYRVTGAGAGKPTLFLFEGAAAMTAGPMVSDLETPGGSAVLIWREDSKNFPEDFREFYKGKTICVTGTVETFKDNPVIIAKDQSQIEPDC